VYLLSRRKPTSHTQLSNNYVSLFYLRSSPILGKEAPGYPFGFLAVVLFLHKVNFENHISDHLSGLHDLSVFAVDDIHVHVQALTSVFSICGQILQQEPVSFVKRF